MGANIDKISESLGKIAGAFPVILMLANMMGFVVFFIGISNGVESGVNVGIYNTWQDYFLLNGKQVFMVPLWGLIFLLICAKEYRLLSWTAYICLCLIWAVNTVYVNIGFMPDIYYAYICIIIYATFVILTVSKLANRW